MKSECSAMFEKIYVHIGPPKTGTTAIQNFLHQNADLLRCYGLIYPKRESNHRFVVSSFVKNPTTFYYNLQKNLSEGQVTQNTAETLEYLRAEALEGDGKKLILSSEHFTVLDEHSIKEMKNFLKEISHQCYVIAYVRHPIAALESHIQQIIYNGSRGLNTLLTDPPSSKYEILFEKWAKVFGKKNTIIRPMNPSGRKNWDIIDDFLQLIGYSGGRDGLIESKRNNPALSHPAVLIADALFHIAPKSDKRRGPEGYLKMIRGPKFAVKEDVVSKATEKSNADLEYLEREWGIVPINTASRSVETTPFTEDAIKSIAETLNFLSLRSQVHKDLLISERKKNESLLSEINALKGAE